MFHFIDYYLELTKIVESPTSFLEWSAYATIGATFRHNVYFKFPARQTIVVPNLYVLLVGDSGATRKSTPLKISNFLMKKVGNTKLIEGRASIQGILKELAEVKRIDRTMVKYAGALLYSEELAAFLVKDPSTTSILTDIFDFKLQHEILLKGEGSVKLENVAVSLLSATNAAFLQDMFSKTDLYGGLVGRTFFIIEEKARLRNLGLRDSTVETDWEPLITHLQKLAKLQGAVILEEDALAFIEEWYESVDFSINDSKTGYEHRAHTNVLKLALIIAACEENFSMVVKKHHCQKALDIVISLRKNYHKMVATVGATANDVRQAIKDITNVLYSNIGKTVSRETMLRLLFGRIDVETLDKAIITLHQTGMVDIGGMGEALYSLSQKGQDLILGSMKPKGEVQ